MADLPHIPMGSGASTLLASDVAGTATNGSGPWSENVFVRPKGWPVATSPQGAFPALDTVLPQRATFTQIACTVGGRIR